MLMDRNEAVVERLPNLAQFGFPEKERRDIWTEPRSSLGLQDGSLRLLYWEGRPRAVVADAEYTPPEDVIAYALGPAFDRSPPVIVLSRQEEVLAVELQGDEYAVSPRVPVWDEVLAKSPGCVSAAQAEAVVQGVARANREWYEDPKSQAVVGAVPRIFPEGTAIVYELLQNAADCGARRAGFDWEGDTLLFFHDGSSFTENDVQAISFINTSFKSPDDIGFMGLGFKAVYEVCQRPEIHSDPYHFCFDQAKDGGQLFPEWIPADKRSEVREPFTTLFRMQIRPDKIGQLRKELDEFDGISLVYMGLSDLEIGARRFSSRTVESRVLRSDATCSIAMLDQEKKTRTFLLISRSFGPSDRAAEEFADIRGRQASADSYRGSAGHREMATLTVELKGDRSPRRVQGTGRLYVYLPTGIQLDYAFHLQGNFIIDASRQQMKNKLGAWNSQYLRQVGLLLGDLLHYARSLGEEAAEGWERFYSIIPDDFEFLGADAKEIFAREVRDGQLVPVVGTSRQLQFAAPHDARYLMPELEKAMSAADLASLASIQPLWPGLSRKGNLWLRDYIEVFQAKSFLDCLERSDWENHVLDFAQGLDTPSAFRRLAQILALDWLREGESDWRWRHSKRPAYERYLRRCRIIPSGHKSLRAAGESPPIRIIPAADVGFPTEDLTDRLDVVGAGFQVPYASQQTST